MTIFLATALRPLFLAVLFVVAVAPLTALLWRLIPPGRLQVLLFKDRTGPGSSFRDHLLITSGVIAFYAALVMIPA